MNEQTNDGQTDPIPGAEEAHHAGQQSAGEAAGGAGAADGESKRDMSWYLDRIWTEIKDVSRQVEAETRRGSRIAKLHFEIRRLSRKLGEHTSSLGRLVYEAHKAGDGYPETGAITGYDAVVSEIESVNAEIAAKQAEVDELKSREAAVA